MNYSWDNRSSNCTTQHGNHTTHMCPLAHWDMTYIQQTVHVTQRHSYLHQSRQRLSHSKCDAPSQLFTPDSQPRHGGSNSSGGSAIVTRLSNCDAPSQLISLVLLTASLALLRFDIRSRPAISITKRKKLLASPLRRLAHRAVGR